MKLPFGKRDCRDCGYFLVQEMTGISVCNFHQMSLPGFQQRDKNGRYVAVYPACEDFYQQDSPKKAESGESGVIPEIPF